MVSSSIERLFPQTLAILKISPISVNWIKVFLSKNFIWLFQNSLKNGMVYSKGFSPKFECFEISHKIKDP